MSVEPGEGGQEFIEGTEDKIFEVKTLLKEYDIKAIVNVDGGINDVTVGKCHLCDIVTAGSYIIKGEDFQERITSLR